jgi:hypothetical protein
MSFLDDSFSIIDLTITANIITGWGWEGMDMENRPHIVGRQEREGGRKGGQKIHSPSSKSTPLLYH